MIIILASIILFSFALVINKNNRRTLSLVSFVLFALILLLTNGQFETNDYPQYLNFYLGDPSMYGTLDLKGGYDLEWPYAEFVKIIRAVFPRYAYIYILCYGLMWLIPMYKLLSKGSNNIPLSLFLICTVLNCSQLLFIITAQRQMIATVSFFWIYYIIKYTNIKKKGKILLVVALSILGLLAHSSSYFVLPLLLGLYFLKIPSKKILYLAVIISFIIGPAAQQYFGTLLNGLIISFGSSEEIARSTSYFIKGMYDFGGMTYLGLLPTTLACLIFIYFYDKEGINNYGTKCFTFAVIFFNIFNSVPLISRGLNVFFLLGAILGIPYIKNKNSAFKMKLLFLVVAAGLIYSTINQYQVGSTTNGIFPYPYIWDN